MSSSNIAALMCWLCEQRWQQVCSVLQQFSAVLEQVRLAEMVLRHPAI
jgi:hypothetical protein